MGLRFGVATDGYSVEGGYNDTVGPSNNWVWWERRGRVPGWGAAHDFWGRPEVLLDRAAAAGCDTFGLSVEWARTEPADGAPDLGALDRYAAILEACAARGLEPVVTLYHRAHPWWLGEEFWLTPGSPERFAAHADAVVSRLAGHCRRWVTVADPAGLANSGWITGGCPPGRRLVPADAYAVLDNLLCGHLLAYRVIHRVQPDAEVMLGGRCSSLYELARLPADLLLSGRVLSGGAPIDQFVAGRRRAYDALHPVVSPGWRAARRLSGALCPYGGGWPLRRPSPRRVLRVLAEAGGPEVDGWWLDSGDGRSAPGSAWWAADGELPVWVSGELAQSSGVLSAPRAGAPVSGFLLRVGPGSPGGAEPFAELGRLIAG